MVVKLVVSNDKPMKTFSRINNLTSFFRLNEGFATLYENFMSDYVYPERRYMDTYLTDVVQYVMEYDTTRRAMTYYVESPSNIDNLFDVIAYDKCGNEINFSKL